MKISEEKKIIKLLENGEIDVFNIPEEYKNSIEIVNFERKTGLRITGKRGFDIISNTFFVEEELVSMTGTNAKRTKSIFLSFENFRSYYRFLNGDIYNNACYTFCNKFKISYSSHIIYLDKLMKRKSFIENTIDDYSIELSTDEKEQYKKGKKIHKLCKQWINKFNNCSNYNEFVSMTRNYRKSKLSSIVDITFFFFQYIFADVEDKKRFSVIMEYMSSGNYPQNKIINALCSIYDPNEVLLSFNYSDGSQTTRYKYKNRLKKHVQFLKKEEIIFHTKAFFDKTTHYFCEITEGFYKENMYYPAVTICRYFESFDKFINHRNGDLTNCDLSAAFECSEDFSKYTINETTKLPPNINGEIKYTVKKYYQNKKFYVTQTWRNLLGITLKEYKHEFNYFFDFCTFLKGDLSNADLLFCDGLFNLKQWDSINFTGAKMKSILCEKFGLQFTPYIIDAKYIESFSQTEKNEKETILMPQSSINSISETEFQNLSQFDVNCDRIGQRVYYISDIHLMHRIQNAKCRSKEDIIYVIQQIVNTIADETGSLLLINGDVASDFNIFKLFVKILSHTLHNSIQVVFTLGNHELWSFPNLQIDQIVSEYRKLLDQYGMHLIHNDLFYISDNNSIDSHYKNTFIIKYHELCQMNKTEILNRLKCARFVILGGLGFSGYNLEFNANNGIYRKTIKRVDEIKESKKFENLYKHLLPILTQKNTIILTHMPKKDWCKTAEPAKRFVYVSGHTHRNNFYDDGDFRIYSDNQIGYYNDNIHLKSFLIDNDYDYFFEFPDGIFEITKEQYNDFHRGKNIFITFQRKVNKLYMLKKNGYYCFIHESKNKSFTILHGGAMKKLEIHNIQYYYENMETMISKIKTPLDKYTSFQKQIANSIKRIGGSGEIHGAIIDIDFFNHIYVNPFDFSITGYWAFDIINKKVYSTIPALLKNNCPQLYKNYIRTLETKSKNDNSIVIAPKTNVSTLSKIYLNTDIYKASREIKKMQRLSTNILTSWYENLLKNKLE